MSNFLPCPHCGGQMPAISLPVGPTWNRIFEVLMDGRKALAVREISAAAGCSHALADAWFAHLEHCVKSWPLEAEAAALAEEVDAAFEKVTKPDHFTNFSHCDECFTHDETLRKSNRETISRAQLGRSGWSPVGFCSAAGLMYYFPALVRYCYLPDLLLYDGLRESVAHAIGPKGQGEQMFALANASQQQAIGKFAQWLQAQGVNDEIGRAHV